MKIIRNDEQHFIARQSNITGIVMGIIFMAVGVGVVVLMIAKPAGTVTQNAGIGKLIGGVFALAGLAVALLSKAVTLVSDRAAGTLTISYRSLVRRSEAVVPASSIDRIAEMSSVTGQSGSNQVLRILLKDGSDVTVQMSRPGFSFNGIPLSMLMKHTDIGRALAASLGVEFEQLGFNSITAVRNTITEAMNQANQYGANVPSSAPILEQPSSAAPSFTPASPTVIQPELPQTPGSVGPAQPITPTPADNPVVPTDQSIK